MDGEHRLDAVELVQVAVVQVQVDGGQRGLPVVAVDDVRLKVGVEQHLQNGAGKEGEPFAVVIEAVQAAALEVILVVDKVEGDAVVFRLEQAAVLAAPAHRHAEVGDIGQPVAEFQVAIQRHDHTAVDAVAHQSLGQGAGHIGQAAGFGKGGCLAGSVKDSHSLLLKWGAARGARQKNKQEKQEKGRERGVWPAPWTPCSAAAAYPVAGRMPGARRRTHCRQPPWAAAPPPPSQKGPAAGEMWRQSLMSVRLYGSWRQRPGRNRCRRAACPR